nr:GNAT family N-acetyltransferase [Nocardioides luti]
MCDLVDTWWCDLFGITRDELWQAATVQPHGRLEGYAGLFVAWRDHGVHVSAPQSAEVVPLPPPDSWTSYAASIGGTVIGPATHHYLDVDPGPDPRVVRVEVADLAELRAVVTDEEWWESGSSDDDVEVAFGLVEDGALVAAASLSPYAGSPRDLGVLVAPSHRGRRLVDAVGRTAASYAIREHRVARWVARTANTASMAAAARLGFEPWCEQLAVRLPTTTP